ncbi:MAG: NifB/NifX family molybdenum-iron cluster-binding protein [Ignavibacteria bacterium]|jgi:predicted Fe-Mo cluster-binding NifX family protein
MKIAVASNNEKNVAGHVGQCKGFLIYEIKDNNIARVDLRINKFTHHWQNEHQHQHHRGHGRGGHGHGRLVEGLKDCNALIFKSGGWRMIENLQENNIKPVLTDERFADDAVNKYINGELEEKELTGCEESHTD